MANIAPATAYEMMGRPSPADLEKRVNDAQKAYLQAPDPIAQQTAFDLVSKYFDVMEYIENQSALTEAKSIMGAVSAQIGELKKMLLYTERIRVDEHGTVAYEIVDTHGNTIGKMTSADSLSIAKQHNLTVDLMAMIAKGNEKALTDLRKIAQDVVDHTKRTAKIQELVADVTRVLLKGLSLTITQDTANLTVAKPPKSEYKERLKLLKEGKVTSIDKRGLIHTHKSTK